MSQCVLRENVPELYNLPRRRIQMREVPLRMNEQAKYEAIKRLVETGGNKKRCAVKLNITVRQVNRLINKYKGEGKSAFIHGNRSRTPKNKIEVAFSNQIIQLAKTEYKGDRENYLICNYRHFQDLLARNENIFIKYSTLYCILMREKIRSPRIQRITRRRLKREELIKEKIVKIDQDIEKIIDHQISIEDAHPRKEKCKYFGELVQMDACSQVWSNNLFMHLHLAVDNATGIPLGGYFDTQETLNGYYHLFKQILDKYGAPAKFLTDKRTVFIYESSKRKSDENDTLTQFAYACKLLGTSLETTSVPESKGQIERYNGIFQDRLKVELILKDIKTIEDANSYLINIFIPNYIKEFCPNYEKYDSVFEPVDKDKIDYYLSKISRRIVDKGCTISSKKQSYGFYDENDKRLFYSSGTKCAVIETLNNELYVSIDDKVLVLKPILKNALFSEEFDGPIIKKEGKRKIPPMDHPWRYSNYDKFQQAFKAEKYFMC